MFLPLLPDLILPCIVLIPNADWVLKLSSGVFGMVEVISTSAPVMIFCLAVSSVYQSFFEWMVIRDLALEELCLVLAYIYWRVANESFMFLGWVIWYLYFSASLMVT